MFRSIIRHLDNYDSMSLWLERELSGYENKKHTATSRQLQLQLIKKILQINNVEVVKKIKVSGIQHIITTTPEIYNTYLPLFIEKNYEYGGDVITIGKQNQNLIFDFTKTNASLSYVDTNPAWSSSNTHKKDFDSHDCAYEMINDISGHLFREFEKYKSSPFTNLPDGYIVINTVDLLTLNLEAIFDNLEEKHH